MTYETLCIHKGRCIQQNLYLIERGIAAFAEVHVDHEADS